MQGGRLPIGAGKATGVSVVGGKARGGNTEPWQDDRLKASAGRATDDAESRARVHRRNGPRADQRGNTGAVGAVVGRMRRAVR